MTTTRRMDRAYYEDLAAAREAYQYQVEKRAAGGISDDPLARAYQERDNAAHLARCAKEIARAHRLSVREVTQQKRV